MNESDETRVYKLAKSKLISLLVAILAITVTIVLDEKSFSLTWFIFLCLVSFFSFLPFTYKLTTSESGISSSSLFRTKILRWNEINELQTKSGGISLVNSDQTVKIFVKTQIDDYPDFIKLIQQKRPNLWLSINQTEFHQRIFENIFILIIGIGLLYGAFQTFLLQGVSQNSLVAILAIFAISAYSIWFGISKASKFTIDGDILVVKYLFWKREYHISDIQSATLEQKMVKGHVRYPIHIELKSGKKIIVEKIREGNPVFLYVIEQWLDIYKE